MSYELREHTADVAVAATGPDLGALFGAVADGLAAACYEDVPGEEGDTAPSGGAGPDAGDRFELSVRAESLEATLFDYLDELIYERDVRGVLPVANRASVDAADGEWVVEASARGLPVAGLGAREVKAVTYSEMEVAETDDGWRAYVVLDV